MKTSRFFLSLFILFSFLFVSESFATTPNQPAWSNYVKQVYPQWSKHYWVDRELWGNRGYIVGGPLELRARRRGVSILALEDDAALRGIEAIGKIQTYTVKKGDCLWYIAGYPEHYGNPLKWPLIFKANQDQIQDPDLIYPGQVFVIPQE